METIIKTIAIESHKVSLVEDRLIKMNRKAEKLGIKPAAIIFKEEYIRLEHEEFTGRIIGKTPMVRMTIEAQELKYGNYDFIAALDHTIGNKPIVKVVPNKVLPEIYLEADCNCDHCGITRNRNNTYIFKDDNGYKQVGSSCLKEFFGIDPTATIDWFSSLYNLSDNDFGGFSGDPHYSVSNVIAYGLAVTEKCGYYSKKATMEYNEKVTNGNYIDSTSALVYRAMNPPMPTKDNKETIEWCNGIRERAIELYDEADNMIQWGIEHFSGQSGEYAHNMRIFLEALSIESKYFGYVVSVIGAFQRANTDRNEKERKRFDNEYVGNIGDKVELNVNVVKIIPLDGQYGITYLNIMNQVDTGNNIIWISSKSVLNEGETVSLKGTIKRLNNREGKNQTILTRCKIV